MVARDVLIEERISSLVESQFPEWYREQGPVFVLFLRKYYEWMESTGQALYHGRRIPSYKDIDQTADEFLVYFKEKYLSGIQLETETNVRQLIKHSLDLYRTKGSERAVDLLFRLVFGTGAQVHYPRTEILKSSDGVWHRPVYLEVTDDGLDRFIGSQVQGQTSGARAFVERVVRRRTFSKTVHLMYLSNVRGRFAPGETINRTGDPLDASTCPAIVGSLSSVQIVGGASGYKVGDVLELTSSQGVGGKARVTGVANTQGTVTFNLVDGGYGYTHDAQLLVSDKVLSLSFRGYVEDEGSNGDERDNSGDYFQALETLSQTVTVIVYDGLTDEMTEAPYVLALTNPAGDVVAQGFVTRWSPSGPTSGEVEAYVPPWMLGGVPTATRVDFSDQATNLMADADVVSTTSETETVRLIGMRDRVTVTISGDANLPFQVGEVVSQDSAYATVVAVAYEGLITTLTLRGVSGVFRPGRRVYGEEASGIAASVVVQAGVDQSSGELDVGKAALVYSSSMFFVLEGVSQGSGAALSLTPDRDYVETILLGDDLLAPYVSVALAAPAYGFPALPSGNASSMIDDCLTYSSVDVGSVSRLVTTGSGTGYSLPPVVRVYDPLTVPFNKMGYKIWIGSPTASFQVGEIVRCGGAVGRVAAANSTVLVAWRRSWTDVEPGPAIVGDDSGASASTLDVLPYDVNQLQVDQGIAGFDALVDSYSTVSTGSVTSIEVTDSGVGYVDGETVTFPGGDGVVVLGGSGVASGFYRRRGGEPSSDKRIRDGYYYQEYSYEVRSSVPIDRYADMLKTVLHAAGTKFFGALVYQTGAGSASDVTATVRVSSS